MIRSNPATKRSFRVWELLQKQKVVLSFLMFSIGLMVSQVTVFGEIAPIAPAIIAVAFAIKLEPYAVSLGCIVGSITIFSSLPTAAVSSIMIMIVCTILSLKSGKKSVRNTIISLIGVMIISELVCRSMTTYELIIGSLEMVSVIIMFSVFYSAGSAIKTKKVSRVFNEEEILCIALTACVILLGAAPIHIGWFWPTASLCILITMACAYWGSVGTGAAVGIACGLVLSLTGQVNVLFIGNMGAVGLTAGLLRGYKKPGIIIGTVLANALVTLYANGSTFVILSFADILLASVVLLIIPQKSLNQMGKHIDVMLQRKSSEKYYLDSIRQTVSQRLDAICELFARMGNTLRESESEIVVRQMEGASKMMNLVSHSFDIQVGFENELEKSVKALVEELGIKVAQVVISKKLMGDLRVILSLFDCSFDSACESKIEKAVSKATMHGMRVVEKSCPGIGGKSCCITLEQVMPLEIEIGKSQSALDGDVSGDSLLCTKIGESKRFICISDGMGNGKRAKEQSSATVELLENFFRTGLDKGTIFKSLNQIMVLRGEEVFSTVDMCMIDLSNGNTEFIKVGAAPTVLRVGGNYECLRASTLPMGILDKVSLQSTKRVLTHGDVVVMMSDGVTDALGDEAQEVIDFILTTKGIKPRKAANMIREAAVSVMDGREIDDMTVMVAKLVKKS